MPSPSMQPRWEQPVVDRDGRATKPWQDYFLRMAGQQSSDDLARLYAELARRVAELESGEVAAFRILGQQSISVNGIPQPGGVVIITLQGDSDEIGPTSYYGTGPDGVRGWYPLAESIDVVAADLTKLIGPDGVVTLGLSDEVRASLALADTAVQEIVPGGGLAVDATDPQRPVLTVTAGGGFVPYRIPNDQVFAVPLNQQALFTLPIELGAGSSLDIDGALEEVS